MGDHTHERPALRHPGLRIGRVVPVLTFLLALSSGSLPADVTAAAACTEPLEVGSPLPAQGFSFRSRFVSSNPRGRDGDALVVPGEAAPPPHLWSSVGETTITTTDPDRALAAATRVTFDNCLGGLFANNREDVCFPCPEADAATGSDLADAVAGCLTTKRGEDDDLVARTRAALKEASVQGKGRAPPGARHMYQVVAARRPKSTFFVFRFTRTGRSDGSREVRWEPLVGSSLWWRGSHVMSPGSGDVTVRTVLLLDVSIVPPAYERQPCAVQWTQLGGNLEKYVRRTLEQVERVFQDLAGGAAGTRSEAVNP